MQVTIGIRIVQQKNSIYVSRLRLPRPRRRRLYNPDSCTSLHLILVFCS